MSFARHSGAAAALVVLLGLAAVPGAASAQAAAAAKKSFDIPRGPATRAVAEFARQAGVNVLASGEQLARLSLNEVKGSYTVTEALGRLLAGSGLVSTVNPGGAVFIEPAPVPPHSAAVPARPPAVTPPVPALPPVVVVPGFRSSVNVAQDVKREAVGIVDVVVAEDVSTFPDANLAESLQRVPGVALIRGEGGEGRQITVRGLGPGFTRVRINGIEAASASGASDINGSTNRSRAFDFSVFPSELFKSLSVYKTPEADMDEGSLGATVDLRAARPFDFKGRTFSVGGQERHNSVSRRTQPRLSALFSDRWDTGIGKIGALVSGAYAQRRATEEGYEAVELLPASADGGFCSPLGAARQNPASDPVKGIDASSCGFGVPRSPDAGAYDLVMSKTNDDGATVANPAPGSGAFHPRLPRYRRSQTDYVRSGLTGALQWRPRPGTELNLDLMTGKYDVERTDQYIEALSFARPLAVANGKPQTSILDAHFDTDGSWDYGRFNAVDVRSEALLDVFRTHFGQHVLSGSQVLGDGVKLTFTHGVADTDLVEPRRTTVDFDAPNVNGFSFDFRGNRNVPLLTFGIDVANPANFSFAPQQADGTLHGQFLDRYLRTGNRLRTSQVDLAWDIDDHLSLSGGLTQRRNTWTNYEIAAGGFGLALPAGVTVADVTTTVDGFGRGLGGTGVPSSWITVDLPKFLRALDIDCHCGAVPGSSYQTFGQANRAVDESITAWYGKLAFRYDLDGVALRGNAGLRSVRTAQTASALNDGNGVMVPTVSARSYHDWLPALNLVAQLPRDVILRFSTGKTMARPEYVDLAPMATVNPFVQSVVVGNPKLDPIRARTYDLQGEWYVARNAMVSLGWFRKETRSFIQAVQERMPWSALGLPNSLLTSSAAASTCSLTGGLPACPTLPDTTVVVNRKVNTPGGPLNGLEFNLQAPFSFLPGFWGNFGLLANATRIHSRVTYITRVDNPNTPQNEQLTQVADFIGLSPRTHNLTLYYEDKRLGARISAAHRSSYLMDVAGNVTGYDYTIADGSTHVDMSLSYKLTPHLRVTVEGQNLNDAPLRYGRDSGRNDTLLYVHSGRSVAVGLSYSH